MFEFKYKNESVSELLEFLNKGRFLSAHSHLFYGDSGCITRKGRINYSLDGVSSRELYKYSCDSSGNWIERLELRRGKKSKKSDFKPQSRYRRRIKYYN